MSLPKTRMSFYANLSIVNVGKVYCQAERYSTMFYQCRTSTCPIGLSVDIISQVQAEMD